MLGPGSSSGSVRSRASLESAQVQTQPFHVAHDVERSMSGFRKRERRRETGTEEN